MKKYTFEEYCEDCLATFKKTSGLSQDQARVFKKILTQAQKELFFEFFKIRQEQEYKQQKEKIIEY